MSLQTPWCALVGAELPIVGFSHSLEVVAALSNHGAVGVWGATRLPPASIAAGLAELRQRVGANPYGVDIVFPAGMPDSDGEDAIEAKIPDEHRQFIERLHVEFGVPHNEELRRANRFVRTNDLNYAQMEVILRSDAPLLALGLGSPPDVVARAKDAGKLVASLVGSPSHGAAASRAGVDFVVAQGYDAGAHTGPVGTFSLVPRVVDTVPNLPVLAAGGVATGRHLAAALALGAQGVWMGTAWLFTSENATDPIVLRKLLDSDVDGTLLTTASSGKPQRQIRSAWSEAWLSPAAPKPLPMPLQDVLIREFLDSATDARIEPLLHSAAGQSVGHISEVLPVTTVLDRVVADASKIVRTLPQFLADSGAGAPTGPAEVRANDN